MRNSLIILITITLFAGCANQGEQPKPAGETQEVAAKTAPVKPEVKSEEVGVNTPKSFDKKPEVGTKATCPVMGHDFVVTADSEISEHEGKFFAFCCKGCKPKFDADPAKYL